MLAEQLAILQKLLGKNHDTLSQITHFVLFWLYHNLSIWLEVQFRQCYRHIADRIGTKTRPRARQSVLNSWIWIWHSVIVLRKSWKSYEQVWRKSRESFEKVLRNPEKVNLDRQVSLKVTQDPPESPKINPKLPISSKITQEYLAKFTLDHQRTLGIILDHSRSSKITRDYPIQPKITKDHPKYPNITQFH